MSRIRIPGAAFAILGAVATVAIATPGASAAGKLTLYCSTQIEYCQILVQEFEKMSGIDVAMTRKSTGETFAQIAAEKTNPKGDVWWGGTGDPHLQAAEEGAALFPQVAARRGPGPRKRSLAPPPRHQGQQVFQQGPEEEARVALPDLPRSTLSKFSIHRPRSWLASKRP